MHNKTTLRQAGALFVANCSFLLCNGREGFLVHSADGAYPIFGQVFKRGARGNSAVRIANLGIIYITANAFILHSTQHLLLELNPLAGVKREYALRQFRSGLNIANPDCKDK